MIFLILGILSWIGIHLCATLRLQIRGRLVAKMGLSKYRALFSVAIVISVFLIVIGWRSTAAIHLYNPPLHNSPVVALLMLVAILLMAGGGYKGNIRRFIRHPQLTGAILWAGAHLLANGDNRSAMLFGGIGLWAALSAVLISRREGEWVKPAPTPMPKEFLGLAIAVAVFAGLSYLHPYFAGVAIRSS